MALPGAMIGCLPATVSDERILGCVVQPLVRIAPRTACSPPVLMTWAACLTWRQAFRRAVSGMRAWEAVRG
jgi:hypothetical protein